MQNRNHDNAITVDIRLCGNIPRSDMHFAPSYGAPCVLSALTSQSGVKTSSAINGRLGDGPTLLKIDVTMDPIVPTTSSTMRGVENVLSPMLEPPSWAVPARGETRLEPVCESLGRQCSVDLTTKNAFRIGRSPNCDVQLMHATSSRRHAMLFHHSNGSCYVVDCGSAHGTFVNGKRISPPGAGGVVVPHKVRRGSLVRFGGPGAPCFVLKSFNFSLNDLKENSVARNTRINALGRSAQESVLSSMISESLDIFRKRSFDSLSEDTLLEDEPEMKRIRCSSPPVSPESPLRLVSPDLPSILASKPRRVTFSIEPPQLFFPVTITPDESGDEDD